MRRVYSYGNGEPYRLEHTPLFAKLRSEDPVARIAAPYGEESWLITRYEAVKAVLGDDRFSRAFAMAEGERMPRASSFAPLSSPMSALDPPEHTRIRRLVFWAFTKRQAERRRARAQEIADELIDDLIAAGPPGDVNDAFAKLLQLNVVGEAFGVPQSDRVQFRKWAMPILSRTRYTKEQIDESHALLHGYLTSLVARKREQPEDDVISVLLRAQGDTHDVSDDEMIPLVASLLQNDSIANQIASSTYVLLTHPDQLAWLRANMSRIPQAVEELLRFTTPGPDAPVPLQGNIRRATADVDIEGVTIRAGDFVVPAITSANRDEQVFADADRLDLTRTFNPHVAFGYGPHHCPGAELSRMLMQVAIAALLNRFPNLRLAVPVDEVPWKEGMVVRGLEHLPVRW